MTPDERHQVDRLGAYADRWLDGHIDEPTTAEEATFAHLQRLLGTTSSASTVPPITRQENSMLPTASIQPPPMPTATRHRTHAMTALSRWQPVFSMAVMFAILAGLVGIAYTGLNRQGREPERPMLAALQDDATPAMDVGCVPYGSPVRSSSELRDMSLSDWPEREYVAVAPADPVTGQRAVDVYENWLSCAAEYYNDPSVSPPPEGLIQFWSDRKQYQFMLERNPSFRPADLTELGAETSINSILNTGTLPLNRPIEETEFSVEGELQQTFVPGDVYELADGRYGVVMGTISSTQLAGPVSDDVSDGGGIWLAFIAFVPTQDYLLIDEFLTFCVVPPVFPFNGTADTSNCTIPE